MDKPIPEDVSVTLHQDRAGCEWFIVTSKDHPDSESEVTPSEDPALFDLLKSLTTAQQQGQANLSKLPGSPSYPDARTDPFNALFTEPQPMQQGGGEVVGYIVHSGTEVSRFEATQAAMFLGLGKHAVYTAPPSAPVGVDDGPIDASDNAEYIEHCADRLERCGLSVTAGALRVIAHEHRALAQQPATVDAQSVLKLAREFEDDVRSKYGFGPAGNAMLDCARRLKHLATQHQETKP